MRFSASIALLLASHATFLTADTCQSYCDRLGGCESYCKTCNEPNVCYGLYWLDEARTAMCFHTGPTDTCPEDRPVRCPTVRDDQGVSTARTVPALTQPNGAYRGSAEGLMMTATFSGSNVDIAFNFSGREVSGVGIPYLFNGRRVDLEEGPVLRGLMDDMLEDVGEFGVWYTPTLDRVSASFDQIKVTVHAFRIEARGSNGVFRRDI